LIVEPWRPCSIARDGELLHVGYRPGTREVSFGQKIVHPYWNVVLLNLDTRESKIFLNNFELIDFAWASNGRDFIYSKPIANQGQNLFLSEAGNTRQITFYPGFDQQPTISPDGQKIAFASRRRQELQVWRLDL
jgi:Tol biopolymer transport system component